MKSKYRAHAEKVHAGVIWLSIRRTEERAEAEQGCAHGDGQFKDGDEKGAFYPLGALRWRLDGDMEYRQRWE